MAVSSDGHGHLLYIYHPFHVYSKTQDESRHIRDLLKEYNAKYVVVESKSL